MTARATARRVATAIAFIVLAGAVARAATVNVFAAASLTDALKAIEGDYERLAGDDVVFNFGASSLLARQIEEGAPADVFFSADEAKMDNLAQRGLIVADTRVSLLSNSLVVVVAREKGAAVAGPADLAKDVVKRLALAETSTVPAGIYAKQYLEKMALWDAVEQKVVPTENVRAALAAVEAGNAEAAIVYVTDAAISKRVRIAWAVPATDSPAISYPLAVTKEAREPVAARRFVEYLCSEAARRVFAEAGFIVRD